MSRLDGRRKVMEREEFFTIKKELEGEFITKGVVNKLTQKIRQTSPLL
jgi:hypothetical protein